MPQLHAWARLTWAAQLHADDMAANHYYYQHPQIGSDGSTLSERLGEAGVSCPSQETVSATVPEIYPDSVAGSLVLPLLESAAHRSIVLNAAADRIGLGIAYDWKFAILELTLDFCLRE